MKRAETITASPGPGSYQHEGAINLTRGASPEHKFKPVSYSHATIDEMVQVGPGTYKEAPKFGEDARSMTIGGARRDQPDPRVPGPASYQHEVADVHTKVVNPAYTIQKRPASSHHGLEPGQLDSTAFSEIK